MSSRDPGGDAVPPSPGGLGIAPNFDLSVVGVLHLCSSPGLSGFEQTNGTKGLVTVLGQHSPHTPLANVPPACWAAHPARHPERAVSDQRQGQELRRRSWVS